MVNVPYCKQEDDNLDSVCSVSIHACWKILRDCLNLMNYFAPVYDTLSCLVG